MGKVGSASGPSNVNYAQPTAPSAPQAQAGPQALLPEPIGYALGGDVGAELAKLALEGSQDQRKLARGTRALEEKAQEAAEEQQISALQEKANDALVAGLVGGLSSMASGCFSVAGAGLSASAATEQKARAIEGAFKGYSTVMDGCGKVGAAIFTKLSEDANVEATRAEQSAARHKRAVDDARDQCDDAKKDIDRAIDFYKEYTAAKADEAKATLLRA